MDLTIKNFEEKVYFFIVATAITVVGYFGYKISPFSERIILGNLFAQRQGIDIRTEEVLKNREINKRRLETEVSKTLPAEIPSEDSRLETIRSQYQQLKQQYDTLGQGLNELEKSLYQQ